MYYYNPSYQLPLYREMSSEGSCKQLFNKVLNSIKGEATAIDFYSRLAKNAPTVASREDVLHALEDEHIHLKEFSDLYIKMTGTQPIYQITPVQFNSFNEGINIAYRDELEAYEEYRNIYLMTQNQTIRDVFLRAFTDEIEHAIRFGFLRIL